MDRLDLKNLGNLPADIEVPRYDRTSITAGIVHLGAGNFHRAHQAVYCDILLNQGETRWGITGVSLRSPTARDNLAPQDFLYTQTTLGETTSWRVIGALTDVLVAPENPQAVIDAIASDRTQVVTTTITEKGYCLTNGEIDRAHPGIEGDLESLEAPRTAYGYLAAAVIRRHGKGGSPLTVLCCDNLQGGGEHLRSGVRLLLQQHNPDTLDWLAGHVAFSSSMVDRVTPATDDQLRDEVARHLGVQDLAPVAAEPYTQWVIQDDFAGVRPPFDRAGALFVADIAPFEHIKLRFLNAGHSMLATLGYLAGDRFIHEALLRPAFARFTLQALKHNVMPVTSVPEGIIAEAYIDQVLARFRNANLPYATLQVGTDSSQKIQQRWLPTIDDALDRGSDASYLAFALAAWVSFIREALRNEDLNDPLHDEFAACNSDDLASDVRPFLKLAGAGKFAFAADESFIASVEAYRRAIATLGIERAVVDFMNATK